MGGRVLAIECATEACSAALFEDDALIDGRYEMIGRGHAERLVPMIAELPDKGRAERILVSLGPGSFTGVRIGLAAARALGIAWGAEVLGYPTLVLVAAMSRAEHSEPVTVCMTGGHGEWFVQNFGANLEAEDEVQSLGPGEALAACGHRRIAGSKAAELAKLVGTGAIATDALPNARSMDLVPPHHLRTDLTPLYGRPPDARLPGEVR